jgi:hypothetical protein
MFLIDATPLFCVRNKAGWLSGGKLTHQRLSNKDEDEESGKRPSSLSKPRKSRRRMDSTSSDEGDTAHEDNLAADISMAEEVEDSFNYSYIHINILGLFLKLVSGLWSCYHDLVIYCVDDYY